MLGGHPITPVLLAIDLAAVRVLTTASSGCRS
jgi:hypothetical protein